MLYGLCPEVGKIYKFYVIRFSTDLALFLLSVHPCVCDECRHGNIKFAGGVQKTSRAFRLSQKLPYRN